MYPRLEKEMERKQLSYRSLINGAGLVYSTVQPKLKGRKYAGDITLSEAFAIKTFLNTNLSIDKLFEKAG